jgi:hypothetical protein
VLAEIEGIRITLRAPGEVALRPGEALPLGFRSDRIHVFDHENGSRLNADLSAFRSQQITKGR